VMLSLCTGADSRAPAGKARRQRKRRRLKRCSGT
jgi:hypothetical protein